MNVRENVKKNVAIITHFCFILFYSVYVCIIKYYKIKQNACSVTSSHMILHQNVLELAESRYKYIYNSQEPKQSIISFAKIKLH